MPKGIIELKQDAMEELEYRTEHRERGYAGKIHCSLKVQPIPLHVILHNALNIHEWKSHRGSQAGGKPQDAGTGNRKHRECNGGESAGSHKEGWIRQTGMPLKRKMQLHWQRESHNNKKHGYLTGKSGNMAFRSGKHQRYPGHGFFALILLF